MKSRFFAMTMVVVMVLTMQGIGTVAVTATENSSDVLTESILLDASEEVSENDVEILYEGKDGDLDWSIDSNGHLLIVGTGDYEVEEVVDEDGFDTLQYGDWSEYASEITSATVSVNDITTAKNMFGGQYNLEEIDFTNFDTALVTDMSGMFTGCNLSKLDISDLDTNNVTNMSEMFSGCRGDVVDLSYLDTANVTNMSGMFENSRCKELNLSGWDTSNVTSMGSMFSGSENLEKIDMKGFDTSNVISMNRMFYFCIALKEVDISTFDTSQCQNMSWMFWACGLLESLDVSNFNTENVTDMSYTFYGCGAKDLDVSRFDTSKVTTMKLMFRACSAEKLDVSRFDTSNVTNMKDMFSYCSNVKELDVSNFDTKNVTDMSGMFEHCVKIKELDVSNFNTEKVENMEYMFGDCEALEELDLTSFKTENLTAMGGMFFRCRKLKEIDISNFKIQEGISIDYFEKSSPAQYGDYGFLACCDSLQRIKVPTFLNPNGTALLPKRVTWVYDCGEEVTEITKAGVYSVKKDNAADGHIYQAPTFDWSDDGKRCQIIFTCANNSGHVKKAVCSIVSKVMKQPTMESKGITTYTATYTESGETYTATKNVADIPKLEVPKKGATISDASGKATYKVTKAGNGGTVTYQAPKNKKEKLVTIPATIKVDGITYKVTAVAAGAFKNNKKVKSVTIGKNVSKIGSKAFYGCTKLNTLKIQSTKLTAKKIESKAFSKTPKSIKVTVPKKKFKTYKAMLIKKGVNKKAKFKKG